MSMYTKIKAVHEIMARRQYTYTFVDITKEDQEQNKTTIVISSR
jgi:hypothetical protein